MLNCTVEINVGVHFIGVRNNKDLNRKLLMDGSPVVLLAFINTCDKFCNLLSFKFQM